MNQRTYLPLLLIVICLALPSGAGAQTTISKISGDGQTGQPGQTLKPFVVEVRENGNPADGRFVTFLPDPGALTDVRLTSVPIQTQNGGRAQTTLTFGRRAGTARIIATVQGTNASTTFTATAIIPTPPKPPPLPRLLIISGKHQSGLPGEPLAAPFAVRVRDPDNRPVEGVRVTFTVLTGGGTLSTTATQTDASGRAESTLTLGTEPGTNTVEVRAHGIPDSRIFSAEATLPPPEPASLSIVSGDNQTGFTGDALANPFIVEVRDQYDDPLEGATVTFAVTEGGGTLSATTATTGAAGGAMSTLTLGAEPGANTVEASVAGISETANFHAEATLPPPTPTAPSIISSENQEGLTGETLTDPLVVEVLDQYGDPMEGVTVTFTVIEGDGTLSATTVTTDADGLAKTTLTLGNAPGPNTVEASVEGVAETVTFTAVAELLEFDLVLPTGLNLIHLPLKVRAVDGMPVQIESVADLYDGLGGTDTVNFLITHNPAMQEWRGYFGEADRGAAGDAVLTASAGILASIKTPISVRLAGDALGTDGMSGITLTAGLNLVGLPSNDPRLTRVSDLYALEGVGGNVAAIIVTDNGEFKAVSRAGDPGDIPITGAGFILIAQQAVTIPITGTGWDNVP